MILNLLRDPDSKIDRDDFTNEGQSNTNVECKVTDIINGSNDQDVSYGKSLTSKEEQIKVEHGRMSGSDCGNDIMCAFREELKNVQKLDEFILECTKEMKSKTADRGLKVKLVKCVIEMKYLHKEYVFECDDGKTSDPIDMEMSNKGRCSSVDQRPITVRDTLWNITVVERKEEIRGGGSVNENETAER